MALPRYYFHIYDSDKLIVEDSEGLELTNLQSVSEECRSFIESVLSEPDWQDEKARGREFRVIDEHGRQVFVVPFDEVRVSSSIRAAPRRAN